MQRSSKEPTPDQRAIFKKLLNEKRIEFVRLIWSFSHNSKVHGGWTMADEALNTYVAIIQTMTRGHEWIRDTFGEEHLPT